MIRLLCLTTALLLTGCAGLPIPAGVPAAPVDLADRTTLDEQAAIGVENAYQAAVAFVRDRNRRGKLGAADRRRFAELDSRAYRAVQAVRRAYDAGNADSYSAALGEARPVIFELFGLGPREGGGK